MGASSGKLYTPPAHILCASSPEWFSMLSNTHDMSQYTNAFAATAQHVNIERMRLGVTLAAGPADSTMSGYAKLPYTYLCVDDSWLTLLAR